MKIPIWFSLRWHQFAITYQNVEALQEELGKTVLSLETWQALLVYALEQKSSGAILTRLLRHPANVPQFALEQAVRHDHVGVATLSRSAKFF